MCVCAVTMSFITRAASATELAWKPIVAMFSTNSAAVMSRSAYWSKSRPLTCFAPSGIASDGTKTAALALSGASSSDAIISRWDVGLSLHGLFDHSTRQRVNVASSGGPLFRLKLTLQPLLLLVFSSVSVVFSSSSLHPTKRKKKSKFGSLLTSSSRLPHLQIT